MGFIWFVIGILLLLIVVYKWILCKPENFPPGPPRLPIFGTYPFLLLLDFKHLYNGIDWLCKYYKTDILGMYIANIPTFIANTHETAVECLNNVNLNGRPPLLLAKCRAPDFIIRGIFFTDGPLWHEQRNFALKHLRDYGFGRRQQEFELDMNDEIMNLIEFIRNGPKYDFENKYHTGSAVMIPTIFSGIFSNFIMKIVLNDRLTREKLDLFYECAVHTSMISTKSSNWGRLFSHNPWIQRLFPKYSEYDILREASMEFYQRMKAIVDEQKQTFDSSFERHFMDKYFNQIENTKNDPNSTYNYEQLILLTGDLFLPTLLTLPSQFQFLLQRFYKQPEILRTCQKEIDEVVGQGRLPSLDDRVNLPYMDATIRESFRFYTAIPSGVAHTATNATKIMGYDIPQGSIVFSSLGASNNDEKIWNEPQLFKPERFIDASGQINAKLDKTVSFGLGKRICPGETFARNSMFLVAAALAQNFNLAMPEHQKMPNASETHTGLVRVAPKFWLSFLPRS